MERYVAVKSGYFDWIVTNHGGFYMSGLTETQAENLADHLNNLTGKLQTLQLAYSRLGGEKEEV